MVHILWAKRLDALGGGDVIEVEISIAAQSVNRSRAADL